MGRPLGFEEPIRVGSHILIRSNPVNLKAHNTLFYTTTHNNLFHPIAHNRLVYPEGTED